MKKIFSLFGILMCFFAFSSVKEVHAVEIDTSDLDNSTYIIGKYVFTRDVSSGYSGKLTTELIMLAAKSIESNNLEDMVIYYKNAKGSWVDAISNTPVESISESFEVEYVNNETFFSTPVLANATLTACGSGPECGEYIPTLIEGVYGYDLGLVDPNPVLSGYEIYEKDGETYTKVGEGEIHSPEVIYVEVEPGERKVYVARTFLIHDNNVKEYSEYSNEVVIDHTKPATPVLSNTTLTACGTGPECGEYVPTLTEGAYGYDLGINQNDSISGYEIYEKDGANYTKVGEGELHSPEVIYVEVEPGERKVFVAKTYATNKSNAKVYSEYSNEVVIDHSTTPTPVLTNVTLNACGEGPECDDYVFVPTLYEGAYGYDLGIDHNPSITGYEIYEKDGENYTKVGEGELHSPEVILFEVEPGERKVFVAKAYATNKSDQKIYSAYSNEVVIDHTKPVTPVLANVSLTACGAGPECQNFTPELIEGSYHYDLGITNQDESITGYEIYEKAGLNYIKVGEGLLHEPEVIEVTVNPGQSRTFVSKTYATNKSGQKIYSDQSNEVVIDHSTE